MWRLVLLLKNVLVRVLEAVLVLAVAVLVLDVLWGVISRHLTGGQSRWTEELARNLVIWVALLGASVAFATKGHLGVDFFVGKLHPEARRVVDVIVNVLVGAFAAIVMVGGGVRLVVETLRFGQVTPAMGLEKGYVYLAVPISGAFMILFAVEAIAEIIAGRPVAPGSRGEEI